MLYEILIHYNYYDLYFWPVFNIFSTSNSVATLQLIAMDKEEPLDYIHHKKICYAKNDIVWVYFVFDTYSVFYLQFASKGFECCLLSGQYLSVPIIL